MRLTTVWLALLLVAGPAAAEITSGGERPRDQGQTPTAVGNELAGDVRTRCWQEGREILAEADFANASIPPGLRELSINLAGDTRRAVLLPFGDTFCLLTVSP
jgi:hypothetical protein